MSDHVGYLSSSLMLLVVLRKSKFSSTAYLVEYVAKEDVALERLGFRIVVQFVKFRNRLHQEVTPTSLQFTSFDRNHVYREHIDSDSGFPGNGGNEQSDRRTLARVGTISATENFDRADQAGGFAQ